MGWGGGHKKKGNQLESLFALKPFSLFPLIICSLKVIRLGCTATTVVSSPVPFKEDIGFNPRILFFLLLHLILIRLGLLWMKKTACSYSKLSIKQVGSHGVNMCGALNLPSAPDLHL